jgi:O-antigen ligase
MRISVNFELDEVRLARIADGLAVATAVSLPWSTTATGILVVLWLLALVPTLDVAAVRRDFVTAAAVLPVLLVVLGALGMLWADVTWGARLNGFGSFVKLLLLPLLLIEFRRSGCGLWVLVGFLVSCVALLALSLAATVWPALSFGHPLDPSVPVKDYIAQSGEFAICAFALAYVAVDLFRAGRSFAALVAAVLAALFLFDIFYIATGRTALVVIAVLLIIFSLRHFNWKDAWRILAAAFVLAVIVAASSSYLRDRVMNLAYEIQVYATENTRTSAGERLSFWKKSIGFVVQAPVIGHGTGSIEKMFQGAAVGDSGVSAEVSANPHNQIFAVAIQLGLIGVAALLAMWSSHLLLFRQSGLVAWIGLVIVVQNVVGSLFNSHLFDFTQGWLYVFGAGVAGGMVLREADRARREQALRS